MSRLQFSLPSHMSHLSAFLFSVFAGRWLMSFWTGTAKIHELYTAACGLYVCWLTIRAVTVLVAWMPQGRRVIFQKVKEWSLMVGFCNKILILSGGNEYFNSCFPLSALVSLVFRSLSFHQKEYSFKIVAFRFS